MATTLGISKDTGQSKGLWLVKLRNSPRLIAVLVFGAMAVAAGVSYKIGSSSRAGLQDTTTKEVAKLQLGNGKLEIETYLDKLKAGLVIAEADGIKITQADQLLVKHIKEFPKVTGLPATIPALIQDNGDIVIKGASQELCSKISQGLPVSEVPVARKGLQCYGNANIGYTILNRENPLSPEDIGFFNTEIQIKAIKGVLHTQITKKDDFLKECPTESFKQGKWADRIVLDKQGKFEKTINYCRQGFKDEGLTVQEGDSSSVGFSAFAYAYKQGGSTNNLIISTSGSHACNPGKFVLAYAIETAPITTQIVAPPVTCFPVEPVKLTPRDVSIYTSKKSSK